MTTLSHADSKLNRILSEENQNLRNDIKLLKVLVYIKLTNNY